MLASDFFIFHHIYGLYEPISCQILFPYDLKTNYLIFTVIAINIFYYSSPNSDVEYMCAI